MRLFYELKDSISRFVSRVQHNLIVLVEPEESEICDPDGFPMIRYLLPSTVDDVCDLIGNDKFQILRSKFITDEQPVLDLDRADHVIVKYLLLLLLLTGHLLLRREPLLFLLRNRYPLIRGIAGVLKQINAFIIVDSLHYSYF